MKNALPRIIAISILSCCAGCGWKASPTASPPSGAAAKASSPDPAPAEPAAPQGEGSWIPVRRGTVVSRHPAIGMFRARKTTRLGSQVSGRVQEVLVDVGDRLKAGQEILRLDPSFFRIDVAQKTADLEAAKTARQDAELNYQRMKNLWEKPDGKEPSVPKKLFDEAKYRWEGAQARERQAQESLADAEEKLKESIIRAPYDGVVTRKLVDPGQPVTSAPVTELMEVMEIDELDLEFSLPQEMLSRVRPGTRVEFEAEGVEGGPGSGAISVTYPALDEATRSVRCRVVVKNPDRMYRPGLLVKVLVVEREARDVLAVPPAALAKTAAGWQALVRSGGKIERRIVTVGIRGEDLAEILEGLAAGEEVWVGGKAAPAAAAAAPEGK